MINRNVLVDQYLIDGCGRCPLVGTPQCKVNFWTKELKLLREIILNCGLSEEIKWSFPCYTYQNNNLLMLSAFKDYAAISFFKGTLLQDELQLLAKPGENSQAVRLFRFTNAAQIIELEPTIKAYIFEAIAIEKEGLKVEFKKTQDPIPEEFQMLLDENEIVKTAFEALSPSKQRGYLIHFNGSKQAKTREARIKKCIPSILIGKGLNEYTP